MLFWPKSKLDAAFSQEEKRLSNFKYIIAGLQKYYQQKLDSIVVGATAEIDCQRLAFEKDLVAMSDLLELVMGVVINCEDKQEYIERMLALDERVQEDLKKIIEKALARLSIEISEAASVASDSTAHQEMQQAVERLERERKLLREKSLEIEQENKGLRQKLRESEEKARALELTVQQLSYEKELRDLRGSRQELDLRGLKDLGELEATLSAREKEVKELQAQLEELRLSRKQQVKALKEELQVQKERAMKAQRADA